MEAKIIGKDANPRVPDAPAPYHHYMPVQIRFTDIDALGHVNNSIYISYFDLGKTKYFDDVMSGEIDWHDIGVVIVNINCSYFAQTFYGEPVEVLTMTTAIGEKSLRMEQRVINPETMQTKAVCYTILAGFDRITGKSAPIGTKWTRALEKYEGRRLQEA